VKKGKIKRNKYGYDLSEFVCFDLPVKLNPKTGKLEFIKPKASDQKE